MEKRSKEAHRTFFKPPTAREQAAVRKLQRQKERERKRALAMQKMREEAKRKEEEELQRQKEEYERDKAAYEQKMKEQKAPEKVVQKIVETTRVQKPPAPAKPNKKKGATLLQLLKKNAKSAAK